MRPRLAEGIVRALLAKAPRQVSDFILSFLMDLSGAESGAVFLVVGGAPSLYSSDRITQRGLDWVRTCWERAAAALQKGSLCTEDSEWILPVRAGGRLVAMVYMRAAQPDHDAMAEVHGLLAEAAVKGSGAPESTAVDAYLETALSEDIERRRMVLLLRRHEWNISRVSRELGVTRTTVYNRLNVLSIEREPRDTSRKVPRFVLRRAKP